MVERLQEMTDTGATFVDLDGTLLKGNSMRIFMKRLPWLLMRRHAPGAAALSLWWMGWRITRLVSHRSMKWRLTRLARRHLAADDWEELAGRMLCSLNPAVEEYMDAPARARCRRYIATAAMEEYVAPLCRMLGYDGAVATVFTDDPGEYEEMRGSVKRDAVVALIESERLRLESFLTDHSDDLPLASVFPRLTILVNPSRRMLRLFRNVGASRYLDLKRK